MNRAQRRAAWRSKHRDADRKRDKAAGSAQRLSPPASMKMMVGELVLRGFEKRHSSRIAAAFERRMEELLRSGSVPDHWQKPLRSAWLRLASLRVHHPSDTTAIGERLAQAVFFLRREERRTGGAR